jgi:ectoine hydroxylase-related dioxygenase (phytanoyl-CoA dioxygenase family)
MAMHPIARRLPLPDGTPLLGDPQALHALAQAEGVVLVRGAVSPAALAAAHGVVGDAAESVGWRSAGRGRPGVKEDPNDPAWVAWYQQVQAARAFHALPHEPVLLSAMEAILGGETLVHPRHIARCVGPETARFTTPPHQDVWYIGGTSDIWTAWVPLVDCPEELGGLAVLPRSHRAGRIASEQAVGAGGQQVAGLTATDWAWEPMQAGDALIFHGHTVHQGCDNRSDRLRLSVDLRYQRADQAVREDSLRTHFDILPWERIYQDWPADDRLKYYWKRQNLSVVA